ncbi:MAG: M48 family metalloprotease [Rhodobacteraceae bacterium]|nr:M48 family metalloprotease [Paracoccaceae bacterium]
MLRFAPILLAVIVGLVMYRFSAWRTARDLDQRSTVMKDPELSALTRLMARQLDLPQLKVFIFEVEPVNGLAAPDGRIFITRGFFNKYKSGDVTAEELASVIAHELGHVALGHAKRRMIDFSGQNAIRVALTMVLGRFIPFFGVYIANMLVKLLAAGLSRKDEYEADAYAAALLEKSGIGLYPQISLFRKLEAWSPKGGGSAAWLMSHPKTQDRIDAIKRLEVAWKT